LWTISPLGGLEPSVSRSLCGSVSNAAP
jgi:hypothetical protein